MDILSYFSDIPIIALILFAIGIILLITEIFTPGFGVAGTSALVSFTLAIALAAKTFIEGLVFTGVVLAIIAIAIIAFLVLLSRGKLSSRFILKAKNTSEQGFSSSANLDYLLGCEGTAQTTLRPVGRISVDGKIYEAITTGDFIAPGKQIKVIEVTGSRIVVAAS